MIVADTDVLIDYLRGRGAADRVELELEHGALGTTSITTFELWAGAHDSAQLQTIDDLVGALKILPIAKDEARAAASVRRDLEKRGLPIGMADSLIAGACVHHRVLLLTRNRKHFERVPGLKLATLRVDG